MDEDRILFRIGTPLGFCVHVLKNAWEVISTIKHPAMGGREAEVRNTLHMPDEVRRSRRDPSVFPFYRQERPGRWTCVVVKRTDGEGFVITAYPTDAIKEGERVWST